MSESLRVEDEIGAWIYACMAVRNYEPSPGQLKSLLSTPHRWCKAIDELTKGYGEDPADILSVVFDETADEMVVLRDVPFVSLCEHHLFPFTGSATVAYLPQRNVVGLSKLARLVDIYARRLQIQERMTKEIAHALQEHLEPLGAGVVVRARHSCMECRGVKKTGATMVTSSLLGKFREDPTVRAEFLALANGG